MSRRSTVPRGVYKAWEKAGCPAGPFVYRKQTFNGSMLKQMCEPQFIPAEGPLLAKASPEALKIALAKQQTELASLQTKALALWKKDASQAPELGAVLNRVKKLMPHGTFAKWLAENEIDRNRASYRMRLANGKHDESKRNAEPSKRAKLFSKVTTALSSMYDFAQKRDSEKAEKMYDEIKRLLDSLMQEATLPSKKPVRGASFTKAKAASA